MTILSFLKSLLQSILQSLGLNQKEGTILLLGLDNAGKTTLLHKLRTNTLLTFSPTERPHKETFYMGSIKFVGWDLGGHEAVRNIWEDYVMLDSIDAILFMVDATDYERMEEVRDELDALVHGDGNSNGSGNGHGGLKSSGVPMGILLNKCDLESAISSDVIAERIGFDELVCDYQHDYNNDDEHDDEHDNNHKHDFDGNKTQESASGSNSGQEMVKMFRISVWRGEGYHDAFQWVSTFLE